MASHKTLISIWIPKSSVVWLTAHVVVGVKREKRQDLIIDYCLKDGGDIRRDILGKEDVERMMTAAAGLVLLEIPL